VTLRTAGYQTITVADPGNRLLTASSSRVLVLPAEASTFLFGDIAFPLTAGVASNLTLMALDRYGNVATGYRGTVRFTSSDQSARLPRDYTFRDYDRGIYSCDHCLTLFTAGHPTLTATDLGPSGISRTITLTVAPASPVTLAISGLPPEVSAWTVTSLTVTPLDRFGNVVTTYRGTIHFTSTDGAARLPDNYTFTEADNGVHAFTGLTFWTAGPQTLTVKDLAASRPTGSATIQVDPALVSTLAVEAPASVVAGTPFDVTVSARDLFGNLVTDYAGTITFTSSDGGALLPDPYTFTSDDRGVHTFTGLTFFLSGDQNLLVTDPAGGLSGNATITVNLGGGGGGGAAPSRRPPRVLMGTQSVLSGNSALWASGELWPKTGLARTAGAAPLPLVSLSITPRAALRPLEATLVDHFFAADHGQGRRAGLLRPRPDAGEDIWRDLAYLRPELPPLAPE
jgi:hypothetical protein